MTFFYLKYSSVFIGGIQNRPDDQNLPDLVNKPDLTQLKMIYNYVKKKIEHKTRFQTDPNT